MKRTRGWGILLLCLMMGGVLLFPGARSEAAHAVNKYGGKTISNPEGTVELARLNRDVWEYTTYGGNFGGMTNIPTNGLIISSSKGLVLIDSSWDDDLTKELLNMIRRHIGKKIAVAVITHSHEDRVGGIRALLKEGIEVRSTARTAQLAEKAGYPTPNPILDEQSRFKVGNTIIETYYPGEGHSEDNITVWLPQHKILFGGCLIKSLEAKDLGNVNDANLEEWSRSIQNVLNRYPRMKQVVPGHGNVGDKGLLIHTLELLENRN
ncbi:subclass B1 metallo-beta-lactamase [Salinithrix halophila]|uniref:beta-lactamase n=1 Tax=Salinithrix halophila TaxID=1485204 RepID=A0ABV8JKY8_9BACL